MTSPLSLCHIVNMTSTPNRRSFLLPLLSTTLFAQNEPPGPLIVIIEREYDSAYDATLRTRVELTDAVTAGLRKIRGLETVQLDTRYSATLIRGHLFEWPEIEPAVEAFLRQSYSDQ